jgi:anti-sigma factor RsiW
MFVQCEQVAELLAGAVDGSAVLDVGATRHVSSCLRCQAELAQYRRLLRSLRSLRDEPVLAPADIPALVQARIDAASTGSPWPRRVAYAGAVAATAAASAGAIALVASRSRRLRLAS